MAECLVALGSNLGDRGAILRDAVTAIGSIRQTHLVARSRWHETPPVGGPTGQGAFLNGAALVSTTLDARMLYAELARIERQLGRVRTDRWGARTLDLDLLLYGVEESCDSLGFLDVPHPRMHSRQFVLAPAADVAPWMVHPPSGWTIAQLLRQLDSSDNEAAIAGDEATVVEALFSRLNQQLKGGQATLRVRRWNGGAWNPGPRVLMAVGALSGTNEAARRKMLHLPEAGPVTWLAGESVDALAAEAWTVLASACPALAAQ
jgi:2-amino-4-hydroxy-6-hydroxymethyldihydropteridine diphosphokinase